MSSDLPNVLIVEEECFDPKSRFPGWLFIYFASKGSIFKVAEYNGNLTGYAIADIEDSSCHIVSIGVRPAHQRKGIGLKLMCTVLSDCLERGAKVAYLEVDPGNTPALKLYNKLGFKIIKIIENYYGLGRNAYLMEKIL